MANLISVAAAVMAVALLAITVIYNFVVFGVAEAILTGGTLIMGVVYAGIDSGFIIVEEEEE